MKMDLSMVCAVIVLLALAVLFMAMNHGTLTGAEWAIGW